MFANFAMAEGRGKAQADTLPQAHRDIQAKKLAQPRYGASTTLVSSGALRMGDTVLVEAGEFIPSDGEVPEGVASVDESAITGETFLDRRERDIHGLGAEFVPFTLDLDRKLPQ